MQGPQRSTSGHEPHRVLAIRGKSYCDSACVFCVEKYFSDPVIAPKVDEIRQAIVDGSGKYNMLFFMNGEPTLNRRLFEYVEVGKSQGYRYFGMSSHFRRFADRSFAARTLDAGFEYFDISLHASTREAQDDVNPIGDDGRSLDEALAGLKNLYEVARSSGRRIAVSHKIVISRMNYRSLLPLFEATFALGVRNFILQPVKMGGLDPAVAARLRIDEDEFMPHVNEFLRATEPSGAEVKLYGMSQTGARAASHLVQEKNVVRHVQNKTSKRMLDLYGESNRVPPLPAVRTAMHQITLVLPDLAQDATFECAEDQFILNAAIKANLTLSFGCRMGSCGTCAGRLLHGKVEHRDQAILTPDLFDQRFTLLCRSQPRSDVVIVTHQEAKLGL